MEKGVGGDGGGGSAINSSSEGLPAPVISLFFSLAQPGNGISAGRTRPGTAGGGGGGTRQQRQIDEKKTGR